MKTHEAFWAQVSSTDITENDKPGFRCHWNPFENEIRIIVQKENGHPTAAINEKSLRSLLLVHEYMSYNKE